jgi:hypothetical protein
LLLLLLLLLLVILLLLEKLSKFNVKAVVSNFTPTFWCDGNQFIMQVHTRS